MIKTLFFFSLFCLLSITYSQGQIKYPDKKKYFTELYRPRYGTLTEKELKMAKVAWKYFENNYNPETGMVNSVDGYPPTSLWDMGSALGALVSAYELKIIEKNVFDMRLVTLLGTLNKLDFFSGGMPNKMYNSKTTEKTDYNNQPGEIGCSALDMGRLLIWFKIIKDRYPQYSNSIDKFILRWNFSNLIDKDGTLYGAAVNDKKEIQYLQEGRLGYEEYGAKGFQLWGFNVDKALKPEPLNFINVNDVYIPYDTRDPRSLGAHNYVVSENYILDAIELGWDNADDKTSDGYTFTDPVVAEFGLRVFNAQKNRYKETGIMTARTEHQLDGDPYFVYDPVYSDGFPWNTITDTGKYSPEFAAVSLKAAIGMWVVWNDEYTDKLFDYVSDLYDKDKGFYEGIYENGNGVIKAFTANNNGIILECLLFKQSGKLLKFSNTQSLWDKTMNDEFIKLPNIKNQQKKKK